LVEVIRRFFLGAIHDVETKFRLTLGALPTWMGKAPQRLFFAISGFIAGFPGVPGENAKRGEMQAVLPGCGLPATRYCG